MAKAIVGWKTIFGWEGICCENNGYPSYLGRDILNNSKKYGSGVFISKLKQADKYENLDKEAKCPYCGKETFEPIEISSELFHEKYKFETKEQAATHVLFDNLISNKNICSCIMKRSKGDDSYKDELYSGHLRLFNLLWNKVEAAWEISESLKLTNDVYPDIVCSLHRHPRPQEHRMLSSKPDPCHYDYLYIVRGDIIDVWINMAKNQYDAIMRNRDLKRKVLDAEKKVSYYEGKMLHVKIDEWDVNSDVPADELINNTMAIEMLLKASYLNLMEEKSC